jgi:hypothetical protein
VDARVCSSGAMNAHHFAEDALERAFHVILDRVAMRLALPASEFCSIVRNNEF